MPFAPGDPWPGTPGGAIPQAWSGYLRFYLRAAIASGPPFTMGPADRDRLDAGNVMAYFGQPATGESVWVDLACDAVDVEIASGATSGHGILSKAEAGTLVADLYDPDSVYDPLNPDSPYVLGGRSRLAAGVPIEAFVEVVNNPSAPSPTVTRRDLFNGTADRWSEPWRVEPSERVARLEATDDTKLWVKYDKPEQPSQGAGESLQARITRFVNFYGWQGTIEPPPTYSLAALQATTLAASGWELLNRALDDELGYVYFTRAGNLRWTGRQQWVTRTDPAISLGCGPGLFDIVVESIPQVFDAQLINSVAASNTGGTMQTATSSSSVARYGEQSYKRTDLGMLQDSAAATWAAFLVNLYAYPQTGLDRLRLHPDAAPSPWLAWNTTLAVEYVTDIVRVVWDVAGYTADVQGRVIGHRYYITPDHFEVEWRLVGSSLIAGASTFNMGPHDDDALDLGNVMA